MWAVAATAAITCTDTTGNTSIPTRIYQVIRWYVPVSAAFDHLEEMIIKADVCGPTTET